MFIKSFLATVSVFFMVSVIVMPGCGGTKTPSNDGNNNTITDNNNGDDGAGTGTGAGNTETDTDTGNDTPSPAVAVCPDGECTGTETNSDCPQDCRTGCGDSICGEVESAANCENDCRESCGDGACTHTENASKCPGDCSVRCGDGFCTHGENSSTCSVDCPASCGDGFCGGGETALSCPGDCPERCGDGLCTRTETASSCATDCPSVCPDGVCTHLENASSCAADCPVRCGDRFCTHDETRDSCPADCTPVGDNGRSVVNLTVSGASRNVNFYAPSSRGSSPPLIIAFHGTSGNATDWVGGGDTGWVENLAYTNRFIIAAPQSRTWGAGKCPDWDNHSGGDRYWETRCNDAPAEQGTNPETNQDLKFVRQIITYANTTYHVDLNRVYLLGFSNGVFFALHAAMVLRDQIAAFAEAGGGLVTCAETRTCGYQTNLTNCATIFGSAPTACSGSDEKPIIIPTSGRKVPGILVHNNRDDAVSVYYTCNLNHRMQDLSYTTEVHISNAAGHGYPSEYLGWAWSFFSTRTLR